MFFKELNAFLVAEICSHFPFAKRQKNREIGFI